MQQSAVVVQRDPLGTHVLAHASDVDCGRHSPPQHSRPIAHVVPSPLHETTCSQRSAPALAESAVHFSDCAEQHCASALQISPLAPHPVFVHRFTPVASATQEPEQQSASLSQRSQIGAHPPMGAHLREPSDDGRHLREQQSGSPTQYSPDTRVHAFPSPAVHAATGPQRPSDAQTPEQQSVAAVQSSPATRHASSSSQR